MNISGNYMKSVKLSSKLLILTILTIVVGIGLYASSAYAQGESAPTCRMDAPERADRQACGQAWAAYWLKEISIEKSLVNNKRHLTATLDYNFPVGQTFGDGSHAKLTVAKVQLTSTDPARHNINGVSVADPNVGDNDDSVSAGANTLTLAREVQAVRPGAISQWVEIVVETVEDGQTVSLRYWYTNPDTSLALAVGTDGYPHPHVLPTGDVSIDGTVEVGHTLRVDTSNIEYLDDTLGFGYTWWRITSSSRTHLSNDDSYNITPEDAGKTIEVEVAPSYENGDSAGVTFTASVAVPIFTVEFAPASPIHDGQSEVSFQMIFSDDVSAGRGGEHEIGDLRYHIINISGGEIDEVEKINAYTYSVTATPDGTGNMEVRLPRTQNYYYPSPSCGHRASICSTGGRALVYEPHSIIYYLEAPETNVIPPENTQPLPEDPGNSPGNSGSGGGGQPQEEDTATVEADDPAELIEEAVEKFDDVDAADYYAAPVGWMLKYGITTGCDDDSFCPGRAINRRQFVTFLWRAAGSPEPAALGSSIFTDVVDDDYAGEAIGWAAEEGVTVGCRQADGDELAQFCPNRQITRAQLATMLYRYLGAEYSNGESGFEDVDPDAYYARPVAWMVAHQITTGCNADAFCPQGTATRAHAAAFLYRASLKPEAWGSRGILHSQATNQ